MYYFISNNEIYISICSDWHLNTRTIFNNHKDAYQDTQFTIYNGPDMNYHVHKCIFFINGHNNGQNVKLCNFSVSCSTVDKFKIFWGMIISYKSPTFHTGTQPIISWLGLNSGNGSKMKVFTYFWDARYISTALDLTHSD